MSDLTEEPSKNESSLRKSLAPFRRAIFRGLAIVMPPLLTLVLFLWAGNIILNNVLRPIEETAQQVIVWVRGDLKTEEWIRKKQRAVGDENATMLTDGDNNLNFEFTEKIGNRDVQSSWVNIGKSWIRKEVYDEVEKKPGLVQATTAEAYCHRYVQLRYLRPQLTIPLFICLFVLLLYLLGKLLAAGVGKMILGWIESLINRIPLISNVYSSVKQVTDFALSENEIQFTRVVAVEYPRRGVWSIGFVTSESMREIANAANESMLSVLMPTSPMPATGFTISLPKSEAIDLNITVDQAIQFVVSCGVVVPIQQRTGEEKQSSKNFGATFDGVGPASVGVDSAGVDSAGADSVGPIASIDSPTRNDST